MLSKQKTPILLAVNHPAARLSLAQENNVSSNEKPYKLDSAGESDYQAPNHCAISAFYFRYKTHKITGFTQFKAHVFARERYLFCFLQNQRCRLLRTTLRVRQLNQKNCGDFFSTVQPFAELVFRMSTRCAPAKQNIERKNRRVFFSSWTSISLWAWHFQNQWRDSSQLELESITTRFLFQRSLLCKSKWPSSPHGPDWEHWLRFQCVFSMLLLTTDSQPVK